ncbi:hypothetical protein AVEN_147256-1 [Araneus ventricosus]|uniref:Uncharacterized protein n=1 Tax=Araneus ventricosus TaxID=182803 RepID=A0A4Y2QKA5_ARAVE|nr:hypothetical protein AVEN_147256-1 [Araneus ventricosus]
MGEDNAPLATGESLPLKCHVVVEMAFRRWFYGRRWMDRVLYGEHVLKGCHSLGSGHQLFRGVLLPSFQCFLPDSIVYLFGGRFVERMVCLGPGPIPWSWPWTLYPLVTQQAVLTGGCQVLLSSINTISYVENSNVQKNCEKC